MSFLGSWTPETVSGEEFYITASIAPRLGNDTISSVSANIDVFYGTDPNAASLAIAPATFSGANVSQFIGGSWLPGLVYKWNLTVVTVGGQTLEFWAYIPTMSIS